MQVVDVNGNIFGNGLEITGPDGKPKTSGGGGSPTGPAGGDLSGSYPNPGVVWGNGLPTYDLQYYSITNPSGFITSATAAATYQPLLTLTTTGSSGPATLTGSTLNIPQYGGGLTVGTTPITSGTVGRILFQGTGNVLQQSANLFWDNTNSRLGIGTASPNMSLDVRTGNVGIGVTSDAGFKLDVNGTARVQNVVTITKGGNNYFTLDASANTVAPFMQFFYAGVRDVRISAASNGFNFTEAGFVTPTQINAGNIVSFGNFTSGPSTGQSFLSLSGANGNTSAIYFRESGVAFRGALGFAGGSSDFTILQNLTNFNTFSGNERLRIFGATGNVAINTTTDAGYKLDVNGTARVSGAITGADGSSFNGVIFDGGGTRRIRPFINSLDITDSAGAIGFRVSSSGTTISQSFNSVQFVRGLNSMVHSQGATQIMTFTLNGQYLNHLTPFADIVASGYAPSAPSGNNTTLRIYTTNTTSGIYGNIIISHNGTSKTGNVLIGTSTNVASAIVNVDSTTQGFLPPRMTNAQMLAIATPAAGLVVYDTTNNKHCGYDGTTWQNFY